MHPEHSAMTSRLIMEERHREAAAWRRTTAARQPAPLAWRSRVGALLVRVGTRLAEPRPIGAARRA